MSNSLLAHTQGIRGFDHVKWDWSGGVATAHIRRQKERFRCAACGSADVTATPVHRRTVRGLPLGKMPFEVDIQMHRLLCHECDAYRMERLEFLSSSHSHITRSLERTIVELRADMAISAISKHYGIDWKTVKEAEKKHLAKKYATVDLKGVEVIGMDEIYIGHKRYKTIVRDLGTGAVLHVGDGRGAEALEPFGRRVKRAGVKVRAIAMDMAGGYTAWAKQTLPDAVVVYDHFHLIKLMNEKLDKVRRRLVNDLDDSQTQFLKKNASYS